MCSTVVLWAGFLLMRGYFRMGIRMDWLAVDTLAVDFLKAPYWLIYLEAARTGRVPGRSKQDPFLKPSTLLAATLTSSILLFIIFFK